MRHRKINNSFTYPIHKEIKPPKTRIMHNSCTQLFIGRYIKKDMCIQLFMYVHIQRYAIPG